MHDRHAPRPNPPKRLSNYTDAQEIRETFGISPFWRLEEELTDKQHPLPDTVVHEKDAEKYHREGGTDALIVGEKGSGKSTLGLWLATHLMSVNDEAVVWRGSRQRSEWLPLKPWTKLLLPAGVDADAYWEPEDLSQTGEREPADLSKHVASVERYDGLRDLLQRLERHQFHVIYPDPQFRECTDIMDYSDYSPYPVEYVTPDEAEAAQAHPQKPNKEPTPLVHWWVAFAVARLELGPYDWTTILFDEAADLLPDGARADKSQNYEKVKAMRRVMADSRKYYLSLFLFCHHEQNVHHDIRRTFSWRVNMPDGTANPCQENNDQSPVGFSQIPMIYDQLSQTKVGRGIWWTETNFTKFGWDDFKKAPEDNVRTLRIDVRTDEQKDERFAPIRARAGSTETNGGGDDGEVATDD